MDWDLGKFLLEAWFWISRDPLWRWSEIFWMEKRTRLMKIGRLIMWIDETVCFFFPYYYLQTTDEHSNVWSLIWFGFGNSSMVPWVVKFLYVRIFWIVWLIKGFDNNHLRYRMSLTMSGLIVSFLNTWILICLRRFDWWVMVCPYDLTRRGTVRTEYSTEYQQSRYNRCNRYNKLVRHLK